MVTLMLLMITAFALLPSGFNWQEYTEGGNQVEGSWEVKLQWGSVFAIAVFIALRHSTLAIAYLKAANPFVIAMVVYCTIGILWSPMASITFKKVIQFAGIVMAAVAFQFTGRDLSHLLKTILAVLVGIEVISAIAAVFFPTLGIDAYFGTAWRGIASGKNDFGYIGSLSVIFWVVLANLQKMKATTVLAGVGLGVLCVIKANSSTSIATTLLGLTVFFVLRRQHIGSPLWSQRILLAVSAAALIGLQYFFIHESRLPAWGEVIGPFAGLFGKSADLTGRTDIWIYVAIEIQKHLLLGVGYGAFWLGPGSASQAIIDQLPWIPYQSHNGYLDILNELGVIGMALFLGMLIIHVWQLFKLVPINRQETAFHGTLLVIICFSNFSESTLFRGVNYPHILLMFSSISVSSTLYRHRASRQQAAKATVQRLRETDFSAQTHRVIGK